MVAKKTDNVHKDTLTLDVYRSKKLVAHIEIARQEVTYGPLVWLGNLASIKARSVAPCCGAVQVRYHSECNEKWSSLIDDQKIINSSSSGCYVSGWPQQKLLGSIFAPSSNW